MMPTLTLPKRVAIRVEPAPPDGLAIGVCFEMRRKNNFSYTAFTGEDGVANISGEQLLQTFDRTRFLFLMDYVDPRSNFTGNITAKVLSNSDLQRAIKAFEGFRGKVAFPNNYEENLRAALSRGQNPDDYHVKVTSE